jgi:hypothetical protein
MLKTPGCCGTQATDHPHGHPDAAPGQPATHIVVVVAAGSTADVTAGAEVCRTARSPRPHSAEFTLCLPKGSG